MQDRDLKELEALQKRIYAKLNETMSLSRELGEAVERQDQISVQMLLASRQKPILELQELYATMNLKRCDLTGADEEDFDRLTSGGEARTEAEEAVVQQRAMNQRLLERLVEVDRGINDALCKERSFYTTGRRS